MTPSLAPGNTTRLRTKAARRSVSRAAGDPGGQRRCGGARVPACSLVAGGSRRSEGLVSSGDGMVERGVDGGGHPGQMTGIGLRVRSRSSWASSPREVIAGLGEDVAQVEGHRPRGDPALGGDVLVGHPGATSWAILSSVGVSFTRVEGSRLRAVSPEARSSWFARSASGRHAGPRTSPGRDAGADGRRRGVGLGAATRRRKGACAPRRAGGGERVLRQRLPEERLRRRPRPASRPARRPRWRAPTAGPWPRRSR